MALRTGRQVTGPPASARIMLLLCGLLCVFALVVWLIAPTPQSILPASAVPPTPQPRLPQIPLPTGTDPESVALRGALLNGERIYQRLCYHCHGQIGRAHV